MRNLTQFGLCLTLTSLLVSCSTNKEEEALAKAQKCLDEVSSTNPSAASACFSFVSEYSSAAASKLKCAIKLTQGGLAESKVSQAFDVLKTNPANKEAAFMAVLSLDLANNGYQTALAAQDYCKNSNDPGFIYISSLVVAGTALNNAFAGINSGNGMTTPETQIANVLSACTGASASTGTCTQLVADLSPVAVTMADAYCGQATADQQVCGKINQAVEATGGDTAKVGAALLCFLKGANYTGTATCP